MIARDHDAAIRSLERSLELGENPISANNLSLASHLSGNDDKALRLVLGRSAPQGHAALQRAYDEGGWEGMVRVIYYADVAQSAIACTAIPGFGAHVYALLGEKEKMYACIDEALAEPSVFGMYFKGYPTWDPYRDKPRFQAILRRLGLAD